MKLKRILSFKRNKRLNSINEINIPKQDISFLTLIKLILNTWYVYAILFFASIIIGYLIGHNIPKTYTSKVQLAPETNNDLSKFGSLSGLASQFGVDMSSQTSDAIVPDLYPTVVNSTKFIVGLCNIPVRSKDGKLRTDLYTYCSKFQKDTPWGNLFAKKKGNIKNEKENIINPFELTKEQSDVIEGIKGMIKCDVDKQTSVITIKATTQDPLISAILVDSVSNHLQRFITDYRTSKSRHEVQQTKKLLNEAKSKYKKIEQEYVSYADANEDLNLQSYISRRDELENEMQLRYNIYTQLQQQLQIAEAKVQERTPIYAVIEPATVPIKKSGPHTMLICIALIFTSIFIYTAILIIRYTLLVKKQTSKDQKEDEK